jgi:hypothetical protein
MTERDWNEATDPTMMVQWLGRSQRASERKVRLALCACCRQVWTEFQGKGKAWVIELAERLAEGLVSRKELRAVRQRLIQLLQEQTGWRDEDLDLLMDSFEGFDFDVATFASSRALQENLRVPHLRQVIALVAQTMPESRKYKYRTEFHIRVCKLVRCIFGNPFRPLPPRPTAAGGLVSQLALTGYEDRILPEGRLDNARLAILADALEEEAGFEDAVMLAHLRQPNAVHVRGCFAVDWILGKS